MLFGRAALLCTNILVMIDQLPVDRPPGLGFGSQACVLKLYLNYHTVYIYNLKITPPYIWVLVYYDDDDDGLIMAPGGFPALPPPGPMLAAASTTLAVGVADQNR